jgi:hypothetical protein
MLSAPGLPMQNTQNRIPDEMLADVLAEATRLHAAATAGYSFEDLQQACDEIQIPAYIVKQAIENVQAARAHRQRQRQQFQNFLKQQLLKGLPLGAAIFLGATPIVGFLQFYQFPEPQAVKAPLTTMTVKVGQLQYLEGPKDLSIAVRSVSSDGAVSGVIGMDAYQALELGKNRCRKIIESLPPACAQEPATIGESYIYAGLQTYQIKILEISREAVVFQVDRINEKVASPAQRLEAQLKSLQQESDASQQALQKQLDAVESDNRSNKRQIIQQENTIKELEQENRMLKDLKRP